MFRRPTYPAVGNHQQPQGSPQYTGAAPVRHGWIGKLFVWLLVIGALVAYEKFAPQNLRISTLLGAFEGNTEGEALRAQIEGLKVKLEAEKDAEEKLQNAVNQRKKELEVEATNKINEYKQHLDVEATNSINDYKQRLDYELQTQIKDFEMKYDSCNKMKQIALDRETQPISEQIKELYGMTTLAGSGFGEAMGKLLGDPQVIQQRISNLEALIQEKLHQALNSEPCPEPRKFVSNLEDFKAPFGSSAPPVQTPHYAPAQPAPVQNTAFQDGAKDRTAWESWFSRLPAGEYRSGAFYWSGHRSGNGSCFDNRQGSYGDFTRGCLEAKKFLDPADQRRKTSADYKNGWNSIAMPQKDAPRQCAIIGVKPDDKDGGLMVRADASGNRVVGVIPYNGHGITNYGCPCDGEPLKQNQRCHIRYNGVEGWVPGQFLFPE